MRKLIAIAVLSALGVVVAMAAAVGPAGAAVNTLTLHVSPNPVVLNGPATFSGQLTGPGGVPIAGSSVDIFIFAGAGCPGASFGSIQTLITDGGGNYVFGPVTASGIPPGLYSFMAQGGGVTSPCVSIRLLAAPVQSSVSGAYLCYSTYQTVRGVWDADQAASLVKGGYWEPTAVDGNVSGGVNVGSYHLQCNVTPKGDGYVDAGGRFYGLQLAATAQQNLGFYPH